MTMNDDDDTAGDLCHLTAAQSKFKLITYAMLDLVGGNGRGHVCFYSCEQNSASYSGRE